MSITTELVFITTTEAAGRQFADVFERAKHDMFGKTTNTYSWRPEPIDWFTPIVFRFDIGHMDVNLPGMLAAETWPVGTTLWLYNELLDEPEVTTW